MRSQKFGQKQPRTTESTSGNVAMHSQLPHFPVITTIIITLVFVPWIRFGNNKYCHHLFNSVLHENC